MLRGERKTFEATYRILHKNGRWIWILSRGAVVDYAPDGSPLRFLATSVDITRQKHAEEELAATVRQRRVLEQELIRANRRLTALSEMDSLTELPNRRKFDKVLEREFRRTRRNQPSMALMMIDVDHFKNFNDLYGHQAGDECLRNVAEALRKTVQRSGDIVTRYGGEEFAAVLTDTDEAGALEVAARMLAGVRALACAHAGSPENVVTVSIGLTIFALDASGQPPTPQHLLRAADRALYAAKEAGRDRIATGRLDGDGTIRITVSPERAGGARGDGAVVGRSAEVPGVEGVRLLHPSRPDAGGLGVRSSPLRGRHSSGRPAQRASQWGMLKSDRSASTSFEAGRWPIPGRSFKALIRDRSERRMLSSADFTRSRLVSRTPDASRDDDHWRAGTPQYSTTPSSA